MASQGISIKIDVDPKGAVEGVKDVDSALNKISDNLDSVGTDGSKSLTKVEKSLKDVNQEALKTGQALHSGISTGTYEGVQEGEIHLNGFKKSAKEAAKVAAGSFDGTIGGAFETLKVAGSEVFMQMGPEGAAAAALVGTAFGVVATIIAQTEAAAKESEKRISDLSNALIDAGQSSIPLELIVSNLKGIITSSEGARKSFQDVQKEAKDLGVDATALATAYAGGQDALDGQIESVTKLIGVQSKQFTEAQNGETSRSGAASQQIMDLTKIRENLQQVSDEQKAAAEAEQQWLNTGGAEMLAKQSAIEGINSAYDTAAGSITDFKDKETGVLDVQAYIDSMNARAQALADYQTSLASSGFTTEQKAALNDMGLEAASAWMAGYQSATPDQKKAMEGFLTEAASSSSGVAKGVIDEAFKTPVEAKIEAVADVSSAEKALENVIRDRSATIKVNFVDRNGKAVD